MRLKEFRKLLKTMINLELRIRASKGKEYARGEDDAASNFKRIAKEITIPAKFLKRNIDKKELEYFKVRLVWWIYFRKHIDSIANWVITGETYSESLAERFADARNYLALGRAIYEDYTRKLRLSKRPLTKRRKKKSPPYQVVS